jgi:hypothetical protein
MWLITRLELGRLLDRQIARVRALQDAINVPCCLAELFRQIGAIDDEAAGFRKNRTGIDRRDAGAGRWLPSRCNSAVWPSDPLAGHFSET